MCDAAKNCQKITKTPFSKSFEVIDVDKIKKPVASACYDKQHVCTYLQPFSHYTVSQKNIPDIFNCILKTNYQILIVFGTNIPDTTCHQMTVQFSTSPNVCFCTT